MFAPTTPIQFRVGEFAEKPVPINDLSSGLAVIRHRKMRIANATRTTETTSFNLDDDAAPLPPFFASKVVPSAKQKFNSSSLYVSLHVGQIFINKRKANSYQLIAISYFSK